MYLKGQRLYNFNFPKVKALRKDWSEVHNQEEARLKLIQSENVKVILVKWKDVMTMYELIIFVHIFLSHGLR